MRMYSSSVFHFSVCAYAMLVPHHHNPHFMVSRQQNPLFTGRQDDLEKIQKALCPLDPKDKQNTKANVFVLYGMGGAGKSEVALKFAYDHRPE